MKYTHTQWIILTVSLMAMTACSEQPGEILPEKETRKASESIINTARQMQITVYKSPTCGCCGHWESHLRKEGFNVISKPTQQMKQIKQQYQVPVELQSCHTAVINGYVIEGHVPAVDIKLLLQQRPAVTGLTAPGMPQQSPGMQAEGKKPANYNVLRFNQQGRTEIFTSY